MSFPTPSTPQRALPGTYMMTPAPDRRQSIAPVLQPSIFRRPSTNQLTSSAAPAQIAPAQQTALASNANNTQSLNPVERAARTVNETLGQEARFPELDSYINQGISSDYDIPSFVAWAPFQKIKTYDIPDRIFEQYNQAQVSTMMGLFAEFSHAWITIDNALYLWDYTHPNPELIGFEDQPNSITAVKLVVPRPGVFVSSITHLLVVATTTDIFLIGVATKPGPGGTTTVSLYQTRMQVSIKGSDVSSIEGSRKTGRIFFGGRTTDDIFELTYQQEEKWFANRCAKINHTSKGLASVVPAIAFGQKTPPDFIVQIVADDTRNLLYTLSSRSTIKVFHMKAPGILDLVISRPLSSIMNNIGHMVSRGSELIQPGTSIVSVSPISAAEASKLNLMATTSTGCRIFFSATSGTYYSSDSSSTPSSMQVHHVKFPPSSASSTQPPSQTASTQLTPYSSSSAVDMASKSLTTTRSSSRFPPGSFFCLVQKADQLGNDLLFISAPDAGRIARPQDQSQMARYVESGQWLALNSRAEDIGLVTPPFAASSVPTGFGNELAVQYDQTPVEVAVLTNTGIQTIRRRRLVDIFAASIRYGGGEDGLDGELKRFVRLYGRSETTATALAVACGQGSDAITDMRIPGITDSEVVEYARKAFIEFGGRPTLNENTMLDRGASAIDNVRPSPRHEGVALYISRLVRSIWKAPILREGVTALGGPTVNPTVPISKLQNIQRDLTHLQEFLSANKSFIDGLAGPEALGRVATKQDEIALQGEHRALNSLVRLISSIIEGLSFVQVLFDERAEDIMMQLQDTSRQRVRQLTFEGLFSTSTGRDLAKELVKAIVNRNIDNGSNVDTVAEALRRKCGSFCSADDVVIFKAQEQLKKASEAGANSESGRSLLNESLKLFEKVAGSLTMEHLQGAIEQYVSTGFYAGAIRLALKVALQLDRGNTALAWIKEGSPEQDNRKGVFQSRRNCYDLIHRVIEAVDRASQDSPAVIDGRLTSIARRRNEAYEEINNSDDEVFQTNLYDWYLSQGWHDRLLDIKSPYVVSYLQRKSQEDVSHADLLWRYYAHYNSFFEAASVQLQLAKSGFDLSLEARIEYLSRAKTNASTRTTGMADMGMSRLTRQELLREVTDLLDIANIQEDLLQRMKSDPRLTPERRPEVLKQLDGRILPIDELYNGFADQASYWDICLIIYHVSDYRNAADIRTTWQHLLETAHNEAEQSGEMQPYEAVGEKVRSLGTRLNLSETVFSIPLLLPMLSRYIVNYQRNVAPPYWVVDLLLDLSVPHESLLVGLENLFIGDEPPFQGRNRRFVAHDLVYVTRRWFEDSSRGGGLVFGGPENVVAVAETLRTVISAGVMDEANAEEARLLRSRLEQMLR